MCDSADQSGAVIDKFSIYLLAGNIIKLDQKKLGQGEVPDVALVLSFVKTDKLQLLKLTMLRDA